MCGIKVFFNAGLKGVFQAKLLGWPVKMWSVDDVSQWNKESTTKWKEGDPEHPVNKDQAPANMKLAAKYWWKTENQRSSV